MHLDRLKVGRRIIFILQTFQSKRQENIEKTVQKDRTRNGKEGKTR